MGNRWTRISALTGVLFVVFLVPAVLVTSGSPDSNATAAKVQHYVLGHKNHYSLGAVLSVLAVVFGLFFYGYLRAYFRALPGVEWLASLFFGGAIVFGVGGALAAGLDATIGDDPSALSAQSLQLLNTLSMDLNAAAVAVGLGVLYIRRGLHHLQVAGSTRMARLGLVVAGPLGRHLRPVVPIADRHSFVGVVRGHPPRLPQPGPQCL